jgi:polyphosphate kinase
MNDELFFNRELSWVEFNYRVLEEALDKKTPVLERLKFIAIFSNNLDEFFMVRISGLISQVKSGYTAIDTSGLSPTEILDNLQLRISKLIDLEYKCFNDEIIKLLEENGFKFYTKDTVPEKYFNYLEEIFLKKYFLITTPMAIDQARPFPFLTGKTNNILASLKSSNKNDEKFYAVIPVPTKERFVKLPDESGPNHYIYIEELLKIFAHELFKGYDILETCTFRITRDAELSIDEEDVVDLLAAIEDQLKKRDRGAPIRLEIESSASQEMVDYLKSKIKFYEGFYFKINGPLDLSSFFEISDLPGYSNLKNKELSPVLPVEFMNSKESIFDIISKKDRLLHLPYESFDPIIRFIKEASTDEKVLAIKITLYRISKNSPLITHLKKAAENGKQVTVLVELKARFDEAQNIDRAKQLEKYGCHVVYGLVGLKIHAKIALVVRDEKDGIKRYIHLSTGNYNEKTARIYTDISLFTSRNSFGRDISSIFNVLTGFSEPPRWKELVCAPLDLRNFFIEKINIEISNVKAGGSGKIIAKLNSLVDKQIIKELYEASKAGVQIILIVRGMCILKPQVAGLSDNITVISIVDRFLEHSRIYYFYNAGEKDIYLSSADWMERNLDRRVELLFPVTSPELKNEILDCLNFQMNDNVKARILQPDGKYIRKKGKPYEKKIHSQLELYNYYMEKNTVKNSKIEQKFIPKMNPEEEKKI